MVLGCKGCVFKVRFALFLVGTYTRWPLQSLFVSGAATVIVTQIKNVEVKVM